MPWPAPPRRRGVEQLDDPRTSDSDRAASMQDLARSNRLFGGTHAIREALRDTWMTLPPRPTLLDVGTGMGDIPRAIAAERDIRTVGVDSVPFQATLARPHVDHAVAGNALALPFADGCADIVTCSQVLHHFFDDDPRRLVAELHRVSRDWIIISDLRRSWFAAWGFVFSGMVLRFHPITAFDGWTSIMRGFTADELSRLVTEVTGVRPTVRHSRFWRLTATWRKPSVR
jgi:SAM-dependent methyltransferase